MFKGVIIQKHIYCIYTYIYIKSIENIMFILIYIHIIIVYVITVLHVIKKIFSLKCSIYVS
jgi:hypothetical protein